MQPLSLKGYEGKLVHAFVPIGKMEVQNIFNPDRSIFVGREAILNDLNALKDFLVSHTGQYINKPQFKELNRKVNKDDISAGKIEKGARDVRDSLLTAVSLYAAGSTVGAGARGLIGGKLVTRRQAQEIGLKETIDEIKRRDVK